MEQLKPINIIVTSYNRLNLLKKTINNICENTIYPHKIFVVDNNSTDGSVGFIKECKVYGKIFDHLFLEKNFGQSVALNKAFHWMQEWEKRRPSDDLFITVNDDILTPKLRPVCWLEQMKGLFEKYEESHVVGALALRIERTARTDIDESKELIRFYKNMPSVYRMLRRSDFAKLGEEPFRKLNHWDSNSMATTMTTKLKKRFYLTTHIYASHIGFVYNKGFADEVQTFTVAPNKINMHKEKPYPDIDPETNVPIKVNHPCDVVEQQLRKEAKIIKSKPEVTIIITTCHRLRGLDRIIQSIKNKITDIPYKILVIIDNNDKDAYNYCVEHGIRCILSDTRREFVAQMNLGCYACDTPYMVTVGDDTEIIQEDLISRSLSIFKEKFKDDIGLLCFNDEIGRGRIFVAGMTSKKFISEMGGHLFYPRYRHFASDSEIKHTSQRLGYWHYDESLKIEHHHFSKEGVEKDEIYVASERFGSRDRRLRKKRDENLINIRNNYDWKE